MSPLVSVVIPTCGRPELLQRCLAALRAQTLPAEAYEVIVSDDTATRHGPAAARNRGWRRARAEIIAFTDDDTEPDPCWLERGLAAVRPGVDAIAGRVVMPLPAIPTDYERDATGLERAEFATANCFVRRGALARIGGFDEDFRLAWREDSDLQFRLLENGFRIVNDETAVVKHPIRPAPWAVSLRQQKKIMFDALLYKKHPRLYRERIRAEPRWDYYLIVGFLGLGLIAPVVLIPWAALTARLCFQRLRGASKSPRHVAEMALTSALIPPLSVFWRAVGALKFRVVFA